MMRVPGAVAALAIRPWLWPIAFRQALRLSPGRWWLRVPPVLGPDPDYIRMRSIIAYGGDGTDMPPGDDLVAYLEWCRRFSHYSR
ncbi:MAG: hypothetical protein ACYDGY_08660 [Acidimicrobiales bacterium]